MLSGCDPVAIRYFGAVTFACGHVSLLSDVVTPGEARIRQSIVVKKRAPLTCYAYIVTLVELPCTCRVLATEIVQATDAFEAPGSNRMVF